MKFGPPPSHLRRLFFTDLDCINGLQLWINNRDNHISYNSMNYRYLAWRDFRDPSKRKLRWGWDIEQGESSIKINKGPNWEPSIRI